MATAFDKFEQSEFITIQCPLCTGLDHKFERKVDGFTLVQCRSCGMVFVNPQLDSKSLTRIYEEKTDPEALVELYAKIATPKVIEGYDEKLRQLEKLLGSKGRILDFACAAAYFVERAALMGWEAHGSDIGAWVSLATERRGLRNIHIGQLHDLHFPDGYFEVVYAAQVFEHLQAPLPVLAEIKRILKPNGILYVDVPNYRTIPIVLNRDDFFLNSPPQHINFFTPKTLSRLLNEGGFQIDLLNSEGGLKWENVFGLPIRSDIADAYRTSTEHVDDNRQHRQKLGTRLFGIVKPVFATILYDHAKVGMNLVAISRPA